MERPHVCDTCQREVASLLCQQCLLEQCTDCAGRRHRFGGLTKHTFTLLRLRVSIADGILRASDPCQICTKVANDVLCPVCDVRFCLDCADAFHNQGVGRARTTLLGHKIKFKYPSSTPPDSPRADPQRPPSVASTTSSAATTPAANTAAIPSLTTLNVPPVMMRVPSSALSLPPPSLPLPAHDISSSTPTNNVASSSSVMSSPDRSAASSSSTGSGEHPPASSRVGTPSSSGGTLKLPSSPAPPRPGLLDIVREEKLGASAATPSATSSGGGDAFKTVTTATFKLKDYTLIASIVSATKAKTDAPHYSMSFDFIKGLVNISSPDEATSHTRHFQSIESIITDQKDDKHFFIQYNDSRPIAQCYAMTTSEGTIIRDLLTDIIDKERLPTDSSSTSFLGRVLKKGKMSWAPRVCGIKSNMVEIFKLKEPSPTNTIVLTGCSVISDKAQPQLTLVASDRKYVFKCQSIAERETIASLIRKAIDDGADSKKKKRHDGSNVMASPVPTNSTLSAATATTSVSTPLSTTTTISENNERKVESKTMATPATPVATHTTGSAPGSASSTPLGSQSLLDAASSDTDEDWSLPETYSRRTSRAVRNGDILNTRNGGMQHKKVPSRDFEKLLKSNPQVLKTSSDSIKTMTETADEAGNKIEFSEVKIDEAAYVLPSRSLCSGIWVLLAQFHQSMTSGAKIGPVLYVPKIVWFQSGAKFQAFSTKMECFELLRVEMTKIIFLEMTDIDTWDRAMTKFRVVLEEVQTKLAGSLAFIHSPDKNKAGVKTKAKGNKVGKALAGFGKLVSRAASAASKDKVDSTKYIKLLKGILDQTSVFSKWTHFVESQPNLEKLWGLPTKKAVMEHLQKISEFFYCVVCNIVIRDMKSVMKRYIKHCTRSFS